MTKSSLNFPNQPEKNLTRLTRRSTRARPEVIDSAVTCEIGKPTDMSKSADKESEASSKHKDRIGSENVSEAKSPEKSSTFHSKNVDNNSQNSSATKSSGFNVTHTEKKERLEHTGAPQCTNVDDSDKDPASQNLFDTLSNDADDAIDFQDFIRLDEKSNKITKVPKSNFKLKSRKECFGPNSEDSFSESEVQNLKKFNSRTRKPEEKSSPCGVKVNFITILIVDHIT